jgi:hypothetical protein
MERVSAEHIALNSDLSSMSKDLEGIGMDLQQVLAERDALQQEADSLRAAAVRAETVRTSLASNPPQPAEWLQGSLRSCLARLPRAHRRPDSQCLCPLVANTHRIRPVRAPPERHL